MAVSVVAISTLTAAEGRRLGRRRTAYVAVAVGVGLAADVKAARPPCSAAVAVAGPALVKAAYAVEASVGAVARLHTACSVSLGAKRLRQPSLLRRGEPDLSSSAEPLASLPFSVAAVCPLDAETGGLPATVASKDEAEAVSLLARVHF